jgi:PAS domain S-box-containing protein
MPDSQGPSAQGRTHLDALFEHSLTPLVLLDRDFNFIQVNQAYASACQRNVEDFPGHNHFELYPSDAQTIFEEVRRSKEPMTIEARAFQFPDHPEWGITYWDWNLVPLLDEAGEVEAFVFSLQDVTARVQRKAGRPRAIRRLEDHLVERRRSLWVIALASGLEVALFAGVSRFDSPSQYLGIPGAAAALIAVVAAVTTGPLGGVVTALVGGAAYIVFLTDFGRSVYWPAIVISIALWSLAAWLAGVAGVTIRRRAAAREEVLSQAVKDRERMVERLEVSEAQFRRLAAENERLYEQQLGIAEHLQRALLDVPSELGSIKLGHLYHSATEAARVGGDFYDVFAVKEGTFAILMGDVSGHGIEAARTATLVKDVVHAFAHQMLSPADVLRDTNRLLLQKHLRGFVTLFLGVLTEENRRLRYSSAGHPEVLLKRVSGEVDRLRSGSAPLGVFPETEWKGFETELNVNDCLVLYTDGVIEARRDGELFGEGRLEQLVREADVPIEALPERLLEEVLAFSGGELRDDVAMLALSLADGAGIAHGSHGSRVTHGAEEPERAGR